MCSRSVHLTLVPSSVVIAIPRSRSVCLEEVVSDMDYICRRLRGEFVLNSRRVACECDRWFDCSIKAKVEAGA